MSLRLSFALITVLTSSAFAQNAGQPAPPPTPPAPTPPAPTPVNEPPKPATPPAPPDAVTPPVTSTTSPDTSTTPPVVTERALGDDKDDDDEDEGGMAHMHMHMHHKQGAAEAEYKPGKGFYLTSERASMRIRTIVEPVIRIGNVSCGPNTPSSSCPDPTIAMTIRRARLGVKTMLPHDLGLDVEVQVKNLHFGITHFYGIWKPQKRLEINVGFIKPPGNIERKVNTWETPWIERGVVSAWVSIARVMGVMATGTSSDEKVFWQAAISKAVPRGLDGAESEDQPPPRMGAIDPDDAIKGAGQENVDGRLEFDPSPDFEAGIAGGVRFRPDGDTGDNAPEPYDTPIVIAHQYTGTMLHGAIDFVFRQPHWRVIGEGGARRDGATAEINDDGTMPTGHLVGYTGDITFGYTPDGKYSSAKNFAYLKRGYELLARVNAVRIDQPNNEQDGFGGTARFLGGEVGIMTQPYKQLRLQFDAGYQWFGGHDYAENAGARRIWANAWAVWRM